MRPGSLALLCALLAAIGCGGGASSTGAATPTAGGEGAATSAAASCARDDESLIQGEAALRQGRPQLALELLEKGLTALEACRPVNQVRLAATLYALGQAHTSLRQLGRARDRFEGALVINRKLYGPVHDYTVETLEMLGVVADYAGDYGDAESAFRGVVAALSERLPEDHPDMLRARTNLAINLKYQKRYHESERILDAVIPHLRVKSPAGLGHALNALGAIHHHRGDSERGRAAFQESIVALEKSQGPEHPDVATTLFNLCGLELDANRPFAAVEACARARQIREQAFPPEHPQLRSVVLRHEEAKRLVQPR